jgi:hypothetical protein
MAFTTDRWVGTAGADWGSSAANWSAGLPNSNSNAVIDTTAVLTVSYGAADSFTVHSLTVGNDVFDMTGGSLTITTTASFAEGFTQTGGTLTAGGKVTVKGNGALTSGAAEGHTAFVFDGTVALANYTLGGATVLGNKKTTNLTGQITLGDNTGANATIDNEEGGVFDITGDVGIGRGATTALFVNAGTLEKTGGSGGTNSTVIQVNVTDTGSIVVATGTLDFSGQCSFAGAISGAGQIILSGNGAIGQGTTVSAAVFTISNPGIVVTLNENLSLAHTFNLQNGAALDLTGVTLTLSETNSFVNVSALEGTGTLITAHPSTTNVSGFFLGGGVAWKNFGTVSEVNPLQIGDTTFNPATLINEKGGVFELAVVGIGISAGAALDSSFVNNPGALLEKTSGTGPSVVAVDVTDHGAIIVQTDTLDFTGMTNIFAGKISGAGQFEIGGGSNLIGVGTAITAATFTVGGALVTLAENLTYAGTFNADGNALMNLNGFSLKLSGNDVFSNGNTIDGTGTIVTVAGSTVSISGLTTLGGAVSWENSGTISDSYILQIGDGSFDVASFTNKKGGVFDIVADTVGIDVGAQPTSSFVNSAGALLEKTGGIGVSAIPVQFTNNGLVNVATGTIEFGTAVAGSGKFIIAPSAALQFDAAVAKGSTVAFSSKTGGDLRLVDSQRFAPTIEGFGGSNTDKIFLNDILFNSGAFSMKYLQTSKTGGVLTVTDGTHTATLDFFGQYTLADFHGSTGFSGGTLIVDPGTHATLLASSR